MDSISAYTVIGWNSFHAAAITLAWVTRVSNGSRLEPVVQVGFFAAMAAVAFAIWISRQQSDSVWMASAITLIAMVVTAVIDFQRVGDHRLASVEVTIR